MTINENAGHITCTWDAPHIVVDLSAADENVRLFLTLNEARNLVLRIDEEQLLLVLEDRDEIYVSDVPLSFEHAHELMDGLRRVLSALALAKRSRNHSNRANWRTEGF